MNSEVLNKTIETIENLVAEREQLQEKVAHLQRVQGLTLDLLKTGSISVEDFESTYNKLLDNSREDLAVFEKAAALIREGDFFDRIGVLTDRPSTHENPLIACLFAD